MKALRFLTILLTTLSLFAVQTFVSSPAYAAGDIIGYDHNGVPQYSTVGLPSISESNGGDDDDGGFFSGGAGANVSITGKELKGDEKKGINMNMILLLVAVVAAPMYVLFCKSRIDSYIYAATAAVYIGMEIANWKSYKKQSEREMKAKRDASQDVNEEQKKSLLEAASQTSAAANAAKKRGQAATVAASGFLAASAVALVMSIMDTPPLCVTGSGAGPDGACNGYACPLAATASTDSIQEMYLGPDKEFTKIASADYGNIEEYLLNADNDQDFLIRNGELNRMQNGAVSSMTEETSKIISETFSDLKEESNFVSAFKFIGYNIADLFFPKAQAGDMKLMAMGLGVGGALAFGIMKLPMLAKIKTFMQQGYTRAASHIIMAGMAGLVAKDSNAAARALQGRAAQYRELAMKLNVNPNTNPNHGTDTNTQIELGQSGLTAIDNQGAQGQTCFTGSAGQLNEDSACRCKDAKNCKKSEIPKLSSMSTVSIPSAVTSSTSALGNTGNALFNGNLEGALGNSNAAGSNAVRLRKLNVGLKKKANKLFASSGAKPIDFNKLESSMRNRLIKAAVNDIKNLSASGKSALAGRFPGVFGDGADVEKDPNADIKVGDTAVKTGGVASSKGSSSSKAKDPMAGFAFDIEDSEDVSEPIAANAGAALGAGDDQVELDKEDIAGDRNKNIFSLITKRYFKTAYPRFFEARE